MLRIADFAIACLLASGLLVVYGDPLVGMVSLWNASPMYSYAFTVPLISLFVLGSRRQELRKHQPRPARAQGVGVIAAALAMLVLGEVAAIQVVQQLAFVVALVGIVLFLFGRTYLRIAAPALAYLLFMVPFWDSFTEPLHQPFQNNSAILSVAMMRAASIPAFRDGTVIALPNVTIEVARACSGVNYLIAVLALALPLSFVRLHGWWRRTALIVSALVIAALANGLRVALIGVLAYMEIGSPLHGPFHVLHGLFVAGVGYLALFAGLHLLESRQRTEPSSDVAPAAGSRAFAWRTREACALAATFWVLALTGTAPRAVPVALAMPLDRLPIELGSWQADPLRAEAAKGLVAWDAADAHFRRRYRRRDGGLATVDIWYFEAQRQSREIVNFKAAGLHTQAVTRKISLPGGPQLSANVARFNGEIGLFWYVLDGAPESGQYTAKLRSLWSALTSGHSNGAAVMVRARSSRPDDEKVLETLDDLAVQLHGALGRHWHPALADFPSR